MTSVVDAIVSKFGTQKDVAEVLGLKVNIAVVDTGVAAGHPELRGRLRPGFDTVELGTDDLATGPRRP